MDTIPQDNTPRKQCTGICGRFLPPTPEYFHRKGDTKDGLCSRCKVCISKEKKQPKVLERERARKKVEYRKPGNRERRSDYNKAYYNRQDVHTHILAQSKIYLSQPEVRAHRQAYNKTYHEQHREDIREYRKGYYIRMREVILAKAKIYGSRPDVLERRRIQWPAAYLERRKSYYQRPDVLERDRVRSSTRRARKKAVSGTYTRSQIQEQLKRQKYKCYYAACGHAKFQKRNGKYIYHIDHTFPLSRVVGTDIPANDMSYLVLACPSCNCRKNDRMPHEWPEGGRLL